MPDPAPATRPAGGTRRSPLDGVSIPVVVIGGGQAGLSISRLLTEADVQHVVLERSRVGAEWSDRRWDSFSLVTPNWQCRLPYYDYTGDDPHGFMVKDEIVAWLEGYAASFDPPLHAGVEVIGLSRHRDGGFAVDVPGGQLLADAVVLATGPYQQPRIPRLAERLPDDVVQLHSSAYRRPGQLPDGGVLVVGSGQSGAQIAEDLHLAGRQVHLATGTSPRVARFYRGRDVVAWLHDMGYYDLPVEEHPLGEGARRQTNHYVTGRNGGHDLDLRAFALDGMQLHGRLLDVERLPAADRPRTDEAGGGRPVLRFAHDLAANLDRADEVLNGINASIDRHIDATGVDAPPGGRYEPVWSPEPGYGTGLDVAEVASVVWALGFDRRYPWVRLPVFDGAGYPSHRRGVTSEPGLYVLGLPWQHTWGSGRFSGVARDAEYLTEQIRRQLATPVRTAA